MADPPYLMTTVWPRKSLMNGKASEKMRALPIVFAIRGFAWCGVECPVLVISCTPR